MSLFGALSVSASGLNAQRTRAEILVENIANAETTRTPDGGPYRRKDVVFETSGVNDPFASVFQEVSNGNANDGVRVGQIVQDEGEPVLRFQPGHPDANKDGYVAYPRINLAEDMVDLMGATRAYQSNVAAMSAVKDMIQRSIDLLR